MATFKYTGNLNPKPNGKVNVIYPPSGFSIEVAPNIEFEVPAEDTNCIAWLEQCANPFDQTLLYTRTDV